MRTQDSRQDRNADQDETFGLGEIARIFAQGVLRLHSQGHLQLGPSGLSPETALHDARQDLEQSANLDLTLHRG
jgi:hypothetical protein